MYLFVCVSVSVFVFVYVCFMFFEHACEVADVSNCHGWMLTGANAR